MGVDVGEARVGLAIGHSLAKLPQPYAVLPNDEHILRKMSEIIDDERIIMLIVGLPRGADGQETAQSEYSRDFAAKLTQQFNLPVEFADESLSSVRAQSDTAYKKSTNTKHFDDIAACYILEEFFEGRK